MIRGLKMDKRKFGYCKGLHAWVPRDDMLAVNVKCYDENDVERRIRIRLSPEKHKELVHFLELLEWQDELRTMKDLDGEEVMEVLDAVR